MQVLMTILYILLFLLFLSILIIVHELGHLAMAKAFNVFCLEYSIGMGPLLFKKKRKNGETQFSIRAIPFGGYVSMYGEGVTLPEGVEVPEERSLNKAKWWKQAIIFVAGVTMNAVLALAFFFISNCLPQDGLTYVNQISVAESSAAYNAGLRNEDVIKYDEWQYYDGVTNVQRTYYLADNQTSFNGDDSIKYATCFNFSTLQSLKHLDLSEFMYMYETSDLSEAGDVFVATYSNGVSFKFLVNNIEGKEISQKPEVTTNKQSGTWILDGVDSYISDLYTNKSEKISLVSIEKLNEEQKIPVFTKFVKPSFQHATIHLTKRVPSPENDKLVDGDVAIINVEQEDGVFSSFGCSLYLETVQLNAGQAFVKSFADFGNSSIALFKALGELIIKPSSWQNVGGIIAVGFETSGVLQNFGFAKFLYVWGFISVNLAVFNLLPFPGLDGWQLLVLLIETTTRKKIPEKVKNIVSLVGIGLLLLLMGVIVVKDLITYVFMVSLL